MFVDRVKIFVKAGDGGRGCSSFRREPYVPRGRARRRSGRAGRPRGPRRLDSGEHPPLPALPHRAPRRAGPPRGAGQPHGPRRRRSPDPRASRHRGPRRGDRGPAGRGPRTTGTCSAWPAGGAAAGATSRSFRTPIGPRAKPSPASRARSAGCVSTCGSSRTWAFWAHPTRASRPCSRGSAPRGRRSATTRSPPSPRCSGWSRCDDSLLRGRRHSRNHRGRPRRGGARPALPAARAAHARAPARGRRLGDERARAATADLEDVLA